MEENVGRSKTPQWIEAGHARNVKALHSFLRKDIVAVGSYHAHPVALPSKALGLLIGHSFNATGMGRKRMRDDEYVHANLLLDSDDAQEKSIENDLNAQYGRNGKHHSALEFVD